METLQKTVEALERNLQKITKEIEVYEKKIDEKNKEIQKFITSISGTKEEKPMEMPGVTPMMGSSIAIFSSIVPFVENIIGYICKMVMSTSQEKIIRTLQDGLSELTAAQQRLKEQEWKFQNQQMDQQLNLSKLKIEIGETLLLFIFKPHMYFTHL